MIYAGLDVDWTNSGGIQEEDFICFKGSCESFAPVLRSHLPLALSRACDQALHPEYGHFHVTYGFVLLENMLSKDFPAESSFIDVHSISQSCFPSVNLTLQL